MYWQSRFLLFVLLLPAVVTAQEARRAGSDGMARLQQQVQQLASERTALQADNAQLKETIARLEKSATALTSEKQALTRRAGTAEAKASRAESGQESVGTRLEAAEARLSEIVVKYREVAEQLRLSELERGQIARQAADSGQGLKACAQSNVQLAAIANEALDRYAKKGCFGALAASEPFTGLKRVEVENLLDAYRQAIEALAVPAVSAPDVE